MAQDKIRKIKPIHRLIKTVKDNTPESLRNMVGGTNKTCFFILIFSLEVLWINSFLYTQNIISLAIKFAIFLAFVAKGYFICSYKSRMNIQDTEEDRKNTNLLVKKISTTLQKILSFVFLYSFLVSVSLYYIINRSVKIERLVLFIAAVLTTAGFFLFNEYSFKFDINN
eukprot:GAHX01000418.1.p1 GENE.GAHX01000418.1~~GAHX01000418.1.p1  ORF type:complete len:169 (+),score=20.60 GAHX01000418.1:46-552(+)